MTSVSNPCLAIILAAGEGTRMRSSTSKVLHKVAGRSMLGHVLNALQQSHVEHICVVVGPDRADVAKEVKTIAPEAFIQVQEQRLGTAHAVLTARALIAQFPNSDILVTCGDTPLITSETLLKLRSTLATHDLAVLGFQTSNPYGYGRFIMDGAQLVAIREEKDANDEERKITSVNAGIMAIKAGHALMLLDQVRNNNAQHEYYLTDIIGIAHHNRLKTTAVFCDEQEVLGVNDRAQLARAEGVMQQRLRVQAMLKGVTMQDPASVYLSYDTHFECDVVLEPNLVFGPRVSVGKGTIIHAFSHLEGATIAACSSIGPFARLRPGTHIGSHARVGNFVEIKNSTLADGAKAGHLTYLGDADIGKDANIGAGTITCNYDGFSKYRTSIGNNAFIGSNSALVAPLTIGDGAYVASGSVVTQNVPDDALAVGRGKQVNKPEWAKSFREKFKN